MLTNAFALSVYMQVQSVFTWELWYLTDPFFNCLYMFICTLLDSPTKQTLAKNKWNLFYSVLFSIITTVENFSFNQLFCLSFYFSCNKNFNCVDLNEFFINRYPIMDTFKSEIFVMFFLFWVHYLFYSVTMQLESVFAQQLWYSTDTSLCLCALWLNLYRGENCWK